MTITGPAAAGDGRTMTIRIGGLLRCCIATWQDNKAHLIDAPPGETLDCAYCTARMIKAPDGVWEWHRAEETS